MFWFSLRTGSWRDGLEGERLAAGFGFSVLLSVRFCLRGMGEYAMQRKRDSLVPVAEAWADLPRPAQALRETPPSEREV